MAVSLQMLKYLQFKITLTQNFKLWPYKFCNWPCGSVDVFGVFFRLNYDAG